MNILLSSYGFYPDIGGIETISQILAEEFASRGHQVLVVTKSSLGYHDEKSRASYKVLRKPTMIQLIKAYQWTNVVFQNNISLEFLWPNLFFSKPSVVSLQTWLHPKSKLLKKLILKSASAVVACSQCIRNEEFPRAEIIGNPFNSNVFGKMPNIIRQKKIVFLGRLVQGKGADLLIKAFSNIKSEWQLSIIGLGPQQNSLHSLVENLGIEKNVKFYGPQEGNKLVELLNQAEVMVVPSVWKEPFGIVALEGLACGCAVLVADGGGLVDAIGQCGLTFRCNDIEDLSEKLSLLINDDMLRNNFQLTASSHLKNFSREYIAEHYLAILERVMNAK
jgi:glycogen(starch) synthase